MPRFSCLLPLLAVGLLLAGQVRAAILNVPDDFETIQAAIDAAEEGDTALVAPGIYEENINYGGKAVIVGSLFLCIADPTYIDSTIIDGGGRGSVVTIENCGEGSQLSGFTITKGRADYGGGIYVNNSRPKLSYLSISNNTYVNLGHGAGGGVYCTNNSSPFLQCVTVTACTSANYGGGLGFYESSGRIEDSQIIGNRGSHSGGGLHAYRSELQLSRVRIESNEAQLGTAITVSESQLSADHSLIIRNRVIAHARQPGSGAIYCLSSEMNFRYVSMAYNTSDFREEETLFGVVLQRRDGRPISSLSLYNSIFWQEAIAYLYGDEGLVTFQYSAIDSQMTLYYIWNGDFEWLEGNITSDPLFVDPDNGDYRLSAESPCIDAGDPDSEPDPDGTRADMGAFYFHQRDIAVEPDHLEFPPIWWGEEATLPVEIRNEGGTSLHLLEIAPPLMACAISVSPFGVFDPPIEILPDSVFTLEVYFRPDPNLPNVGGCLIVSDDPDEPEVEFSAAGTVGVAEEHPQPLTFALSPAFPNPFNSSTTLEYTLPRAGWVSLRLYDLQGRMVMDLMDGMDRIENAGRHSVMLDGAGLAAGVYIARLTTPIGTTSAKLLLLR